MLLRNFGMSCIFQEMGIHVGAHEEGNSRNRNFQVSGQKLLCTFLLQQELLLLYIEVCARLFTTVLSLPNF